MDVAVCHLGRIGYREAWKLQQQIQSRLIAAKRSAPPEELPHVMLLLEHPPVYTLGKSGDRANLLLSEKMLAKRGAEFIPVDRGGDITFHGPGQLVGYPILDLDRFFTDIHRYLRELEEAIVLTCADYGLVAGRIGGRTGVWIGPDERGPERKICAMGIRCSRWVTMHGFAFNMNTDLDWFNLIVPCGISGSDVTSLSRELGHSVNEEEVTMRFLNHFAIGFDVELSSYRESDAHAYIHTLLKDVRLETEREPAR